MKPTPLTHALIATGLLAGAPLDPAMASLAPCTVQCLYAVGYYDTGDPYGNYILQVTQGSDPEAVDEWTFQNSAQKSVAQDDCHAALAAYIQPPRDYCVALPDAPA
jgi:hypothetical protein